MNNLQNELLNSIKNLFASNLSTKYISEKTNIAYTTINELRNYKRSLNRGRLSKMRISHVKSN